MEEEVYTLDVYRDGKQSVSCWELTADEKLEVARTGKVYLYVLGQGHPPVCVMGINPFPAVAPRILTEEDAVACDEKS
jgi:hypothetical protein